MTSLPSIENPHAKRLYDSLLTVTSVENAEQIVALSPLPKTPSEKQKEAWAQTVCMELERQFSRETVQKIRSGCACGPSESIVKKLQKLYAQSADRDDFAALCQENGQPVSVEGNGFLLTYPRCYCPFVKRGGALPESWCDCTIGFNKRLFEAVLGMPVDAVLLESVKQGGTCCRILVTPLRPETSD